jgi:hypothetical protein
MADKLSSDTDASGPTAAPRPPGDAPPGLEERQSLQLDYQSARKRPSRWQPSSILPLTSGFIASFLLFGCLGSALLDDVAWHTHRETRLGLAALFGLTSIWATRFAIRSWRAELEDGQGEGFFGVGVLLALGAVMLFAVLICVSA